MNTLHRWRLTIAALAAAGSLAACGGSDNTAAPEVVATPAPLAPAPGGPAVPPSQGAPLLVGNIALDGRSWINYRRSQAGIPVLAQNAAIDRAALAHSEYQKINDGIATHDEVAGKPGFTGATLKDRLVAAGYPVGTNNYALGEVISGTNDSSGFYMAEELITAIYHRFAMFEPKFREIGTGSATMASGYNFFTANFGTVNGFGPGLGAGKVVTWPYSGQTAVAPVFFSDYESPDPVADRNKVGYPVSVHADIDMALAVSSFTLRARGGAVLGVKLLTQALDPHTPVSAASIVPLDELQPNTVYDVSFSGSAGGQPISKNWSFTTGTAP